LISPAKAPMIRPIISNDNREDWGMRTSCSGPLLAVAFSFVIGLAGAAGAQDLKPWRHGVIQPKGDAGFMLMVGQHDFAAKHGLKLEIVSMKNGAVAHKALLSGAVDSIESSPGASILAGSHGADIKIIGCDWPGVPHGLMVRPGINKIADLKGKTVAVAAPGSLPNLLFKAMLEKDHVPASEVRVANLGGDLDRYKAVVAGVADAGIVAAEFMAIAPKNVRMLVRGRDVLPNYVRLCLTMTGKTIAARRADAINFVAAEMDALHYAVTHRDDTIAVTQAAIHAKPDDPRPAFAFDDTLKHEAIDPAVPLPLDKLKWLEGELMKAGNLKTAVDLTKITEPEIRDAAAKRAGK
jgi:NitT/TauT family transport system substrate-binding protein